MRSAIFALGLAVTAVPFAVSAAPVSHTIDGSHSYAHFEIDHLGFSTLRGRFNTTKGTIAIDEANKTGSVNVTIDAESIDTGFGRRDDHLRNPDFFNTAEFPDITYKSTKVTLKGDGTATVEGSLTMLGVSKPVTLNVDRIRCGANPMSQKQTCGFDATAQIKRSDFGISYALPAVGDDVKILLNVEAVRD